LCCAAYEDEDQLLWNPDLLTDDLGMLMSLSVTSLRLDDAYLSNSVIDCGNITHKYCPENKPQTSWNFESLFKTVDG